MAACVYYLCVNCSLHAGKNKITKESLHNLFSFVLYDVCVYVYIIIIIIIIIVTKVFIMAMWVGRSLHLY